MATCKDCVHYDICNDLGKVLSKIFNAIITEDSVCEHFKPKCRECKFYNVHRLECRHPYHNGLFFIAGFCSYGERK